jgi:hypothetical protein
MLDRSEVQRALSKFARGVVVQSRTNFLGKNASGKGSRSLDYDLDVFKNSFSLTFEMEKYMHFQDKGVSGTERRFNTEYSYKRGKKNRPSPRHFDSWVIRRGLAARDGSGRFLSRTSLKFAIATYIQKQGIRPSLFFTKAFDGAYTELPKELTEAYGLDAEKLMEITLK